MALLVWILYSKQILFIYPIQWQNVNEFKLRLQWTKAPQSLSLSHWTQLKLTGHLGYLVKENCIFRFWHLTPDSVKHLLMKRCTQVKTTYALRMWTISCPEARHFSYVPALVLASHWLSLRLLSTLHIGLTSTLAKFGWSNNHQMHIQLPPQIAVPLSKAM